MPCRSTMASVNKCPGYETFPRFLRERSVVKFVFVSLAPQAVFKFITANKWSGLGSIPIFKFQFQSQLKSSLPIQFQFWSLLKIQFQCNSSSFKLNSNSIPLFRLQIFITSYEHIFMLLLMLPVTTRTLFTTNTATLSLWICIGLHSHLPPIIFYNYLQ